MNRRGFLSGLAALFGLGAAPTFRPRMPADLPSHCELTCAHAVTWSSCDGSVGVAAYAITPDEIRQWRSRHAH